MRKGSFKNLGKDREVKIIVFVERKLLPFLVVLMMQNREIRLYTLSTLLI